MLGRSADFFPPRGKCPEGAKGACRPLILRGHVAPSVSAGRPRHLPHGGGKRIAALSVMTVMATACASDRGFYDLRPAYQAAVPEAKAAYLDCGGVSDLVCECRTGGLEQEFAAPSRKHFDHGYAVLASEIEGGADRTQAETAAVEAVLTAVAADVEDICSELEEASAN